jgi:hypothetical protein
MLVLLVTIIVGFIVGVVAKLIMPGKENMGMIMTTLLGIAGSLSPPMPVTQSAGTKPARAPAGSARSSAHLSCCGSTRSFSPKRPPHNLAQADL